MAATATARGKVAVLLKKCIALHSCVTDLFDGHMEIIFIHAPISPLFRCAADFVIANPASLEEVFTAAPRMLKEPARQRPGFATKMALPPRQA